MRTLSPLERVAVLRGVPWLREVPLDVLAGLAARSEERSWRAGWILLEEGAPPQELIFLAEGRVQIRRDGVDLLELVPPDVVGSFALFGDVEGGVEARCLEPAVGFVLPAVAWMSAARDRGELVQSALRFLARARLDERSAPHGDPRTPRIGPSGAQLGLARRLGLLLDSPPFHACNADVLVPFARSMIRRSFDAQAQIWSRGDEARTGLVIVEGEVAVRDGDSEVRRRRGELGLLAALAGAERGASAQATAPTVALEYRVDTLLALAEDDFDLALALLAALAAPLLEDHAPVLR